MAVSAADLRSEVFVFTDTDARPPEFWLRFLVGSLNDPAAGAATGYRWFLPFKGGLAAWRKAQLPVEPVPSDEIAALPSFDS